MLDDFWGPFADLYESGGGETARLGAYTGISAQLYDAISVHDWDEQDYVEAATGCRGPVLELGCGTGRILLPLARAGHRVVGVDLSPDMLAVCDERLAGEPITVRQRVDTICADATTLQLGRTFELIVVAYFTMGLLGDAARRAQLLRSIAAHLAPGGRLVFDVPLVTEDDPALGSGTDDSVPGAGLQHETFRVGERSVELTSGIRHDPDGEALVVNSHWRLVSPDGARQDLLESKRIGVFTLQSIAAELRAAGLSITQRQLSEVATGSLRRALLTCRVDDARGYPLWHPYLPYAEVRDDVVTMTRGHGLELVDVDGNDYLDLSGGLWSVQCGLGNSEIIDAVTRQLQRLSYGTLFMARGNDTALELSRRLVELPGVDLDYVYLTGSGSESVELAVKLARLFHALGPNRQKKGILYLDESYHGTFFASMGVSALVPIREEFGPLVPGMVSMPTPHPDRCPSGMSFADYADSCAGVLERTVRSVGDHIAALVVEPILGSAGVVIPPARYWHRVQRVCEEHDVLLVADEVATGFGRTGTWFACEQFGLDPDILLMSKGINSGYLPLGAVLFSRRVGERLIVAGSGIGHGSSHNGNPAACAAALATIEILQRDGLVHRSAEVGNYFRQRLQTLRGHPAVRGVRGRGLMLYLGLAGRPGQVAGPHEVRRVYDALKDRGVLAYPSVGGLAFLPALTITREQVDLAVTRLSEVLGGSSDQEPESAGAVGRR